VSARRESQSVFKVRFATFTDISGSRTMRQLRRRGFCASSSTSLSELLRCYVRCSRKYLIFNDRNGLQSSLMLVNNLFHTSIRHYVNNDGSSRCLLKRPQREAGGDHARAGAAGQLHGTGAYGRQRRPVQHPLACQTTCSLDCAVGRDAGNAKASTLGCPGSGGAISVTPSTELAVPCDS
jgi:hypothetical protein